MDPRDWLIPDSGTALTWLQGKLDDADWAEFCRRYGGQRLRVPAGDLRQQRNAAIRERVTFLREWCRMSNGAAIEMAAREFRLSAWSVQHALYRDEPLS